MGTRLVRRRITLAKRIPPAPWTFKEDWHVGAPRVCRTNLCWPVMVGTAEVGTIDRALHLYQHWGTGPASTLIKIGHEWCVIYDFDAEWKVISEHGYWIEFVDELQKATARISRQDAKRFGHQTEHKGRPIWAVPFGRYEHHRRQQ